MPHSETAADGDTSTVYSDVEEYTPSPLWHAVHTQNETEVRRLIATNQGDPNEIDALGQPILHDAAATGNTKICTLLLDAGAEPNAKDLVGRTALFEAAYEGHGAVARLLLGRGTNPNTVDTRGMPALFHSIIARHSQACDILMERTNLQIIDLSGQNALHKAASVDSSILCKKLISHGVDSELADHSKKTPVEYSSTMETRSVFIIPKALPVLQRLQALAMQDISDVSIADDATDSGIQSIYLPPISTLSIGTGDSLISDVAREVEDYKAPLRRQVTLITPEEIEPPLRRQLTPSFSLSSTEHTQAFSPPKMVDGERHLFSR